MNITDEHRARAINPAFPTASAWSADFQFETMMGPNVLWLAEWACRALPLDPGLRVLDLGCGMAISSLYLAREHQARVTAADLWIKPTANLNRIRDRGLEDLVTPILAEAHDLPFAEAYFDAAICLDAYHYFGTADLYLSYLLRFLKPGARVCVVVPGLVDEFEADRPDHLAPYWQNEFYSFHSAAWWRRLWERSGLVEVETADMLEDGCRHWAEWSELCSEVGTGHNPASGAKEAQMLREDAGRTLGFVRIVGRKL